MIKLKQSARQVHVKGSDMNAASFLETNRKRRLGIYGVVPVK